MARFFLLCALLFLLCCTSWLSTVSSQSSKIRLQDVDSLVFSRNSKTTGRRSSPIPQMQCTSGPCHQSPASIFCKNVGSDSNNDVNWECKATLPNGITLGAVEVSCEGYDYPEDPYILKGSCGLEYSLEGSSSSYSSSYEPYSYSSPYSSSSSFMSSLVSLLFFGVIVFILLRACSPGSSQYFGGRGGGGAGWGPNDNPPPYGGGVYSSTASCAAPSGAPAQGPGFWTGLGLGGLGGYFMGRNRGYGGVRYGNAYGYGGGYGGGFGGYRAPAPAPAAGGSSSSTSYGGTRRR